MANYPINFPLPTNRFGLAVPDYSDFYGKAPYFEDQKLMPPYFGDLVWNHLKELDIYKEFAYIPIKIIRFPDKSEKNEALENCRNRDIFLIHSLYTIPAQHVFIGAEIIQNLIKSDANRVYNFENYNPYYRQEKRKKREPITARLVADLYKAAGMDTIYTCDPHADAIAGFFTKFEPLPMSRRLAQATEKFWNVSNAVIVSPDQGGYNRAENFANYLKLPLATIHKERINGEEVVIKDILGDVRGKDAIIRDDVISTGTTTLKDAEALLSSKYGAKSVRAVVTHLGLYNEATQKLKRKGIEVIGTNSIPIVLSEEEKKDVHVVDISDIIAHVIYEKSRPNGSLSKFFDEKNKVKEKYQLDLAFA
jgi:ribose-phosphate pyrophosphokinase